MNGLIVLVPPRDDPYQPPDPYATPTNTDTDTNKHNNNHNDHDDDDDDDDGEDEDEARGGAEGEGEVDSAAELTITADSVAALEAAGVKVVAVPWLDVSPGGE